MGRRRRLFSRSWSCRLTRNYGFEVEGFTVRQALRDGVTFFEFRVEWDRLLMDHKPPFRIVLTVLNLAIIEAQVYYLHRRD